MLICQIWALVVVTLLSFMCFLLWYQMWDVEMFSVHSQLKTNSCKGIWPSSNENRLIKGCVMFYWKWSHVRHVVFASCETSLCGLWEAQTVRQCFCITTLCNGSHCFAGLQFSTLHFTERNTLKFSGHSGWFSSRLLTCGLLLFHACHCYWFLFAVWLDSWYSDDKD